MEILIHIYFSNTDEQERQNILENCNALGSTYEGRNNNLYALDFLPAVEIEPAIEYFDH